MALGVVARATGWARRASQPLLRCGAARPAYRCSLAQDALCEGSIRLRVQDGARIWRTGLLLSSAAAAGAAALWWGHVGRGAACEQPDDLQVVTYNVLAPPLCEQQGGFPASPKEALEREARWQLVRSKLEPRIAGGAIIGLQEVTLEWAGRLHALFAERGYAFVFCSYGYDLSGYMGVGLAVPTGRFEILDVDLCRLSDTPPKEFWPKRSSERTYLNEFGLLTWKGLREVLGARPPREASGIPAGGKPNDDWHLARDRRNQMVAVRLRSRASGEIFCISTYHMPCLFGPPEKVRTRNLHAFMMLARAREFAKGDRLILTGDWNWKPYDSSYALIATGGDIEKVRSKSDVFRAELQGLEPAATFATSKSLQPFESAYCAFHGQEPLFTNWVQFRPNSDFCETLDYIVFSQGDFSVVACPKLASREDLPGPCPNLKEPSDHLLLEATLRFQPRAARL